MNKIIILISIIFSNIVYSQSHLSDFSYSTDQTVQKTFKINLKTMEPVKITPVFNVEKFNKENKFHLFLGIQRDEYEKKEGLFVQQMNPSIHLNWIQLMTSWAGFEVEGGISKNAIIPKFNLLIGTGFDNPFNFFLIAQPGSKLALVSQVTSGYFFFNVGAGIGVKFSDYRFDFRYLVPYNLLTERGFEIRALKTLSNKSEAGLYFSQENYYPQNFEYTRQGQDTFKMGLLYSF